MAVQLVVDVLLYGFPLSTGKYAVSEVRLANQEIGTRRLDTLPSAVRSIVPSLTTEPLPGLIRTLLLRQARVLRHIYEPKVYQ